MSTAVHNHLVPVRNRVERFFLDWFLLLVPGVYALRMTVQYAESGRLPYALLDTVKMAAELAILIALTLANQWLATIGPTISSLFSNGVAAARTEEASELDTIQGQCAQTLERQLNHSVRIVIALIMAFATLYYYVRRMGGLAVFDRSSSALQILDVILYFLPTVCYAYFVGTVTWRLFVTSWFFLRFPDRYALTPRFLHPDGACGLLPLGDLCLRMMYVAVIPTVISALFLLAHFAPDGIAGYLAANTTLLYGFTPLILSVGIIGLVIGFLPLFRFHLTLIRHQDEWTAQLAVLADRIITEKARIMTPSEDSTALPLDVVLNTITGLQSHYEASRRVRMWPVDTGQVTRIWGSVALVSGQLLAFAEAVRTISSP